MRSMFLQQDYWEEEAVRENYQGGIQDVGRNNIILPKIERSVIWIGLQTELIRFMHFQHND